MKKKMLKIQTGQSLDIGCACSNTFPLICPIQSYLSNLKGHCNDFGPFFLFLFIFMVYNS